MPKEYTYTQLDNHLLEDDKPSSFLNELYSSCKLSTYPFTMLLQLKETQQSPTHHPEGNVWNHTMLVIDQAAKRRKLSKNPKAFMWAALLHDIGKPDATKVRKDKITAYDHDKIGAELAFKFLSEFNCDRAFVDSVVALVRWHMQVMFVVKDMPYADVSEMNSETDINEVSLLGLCDRLGRTNADFKTENENVKIFLRKCTKELYGNELHSFLKCPHGLSGVLKNNCVTY